MKKSKWQEAYELEDKIVTEKWKSLEPVDLDQHLWRRGYCFFKWQWEELFGSAGAVGA